MFCSCFICQTVNTFQKYCHISKLAVFGEAIFNVCKDGVVLGGSCLRGPGIHEDDWTFCIQCSKSLQVPSGKASANCYSQSLSEKQAYTWMPEPYRQCRITLPDNLPAKNGIWETLVHQSTPELTG